MGKHKFKRGTSEIGIRFGDVYIKNDIDFSETIWLITDTDNPNWAIHFEHVTEEIDGERKTLIDRNSISEVEWLLQILMGIGMGICPEQFRAAVKDNPTARKWVRDLEEANQRVNFWFSSGCPMPEEERELICRWANTSLPSTSLDCHRKDKANTILRAQFEIEAQRTNTENERSEPI